MHTGWLLQPNDLHECKNEKNKQKQIVDDVWNKRQLKNRIKRE